MPGAPGSLRYGRTTLRAPAPLARPAFATLCAHDSTQRNLRVLPAVARGMFGVPHPVTASASPLTPLIPLPAGRSTRAVRSGGGTRRNWAGLRRPAIRCGWSVGTRFDVLDVPAEAGRAALRRLGPGSPVAVRGDRMRLLVAAGSAEEVPGLLEWLEWGTLALDLTVIGTGGVMDAPLPPGWTRCRRARDGPWPREANGPLPPRARCRPVRGPRCRLLRRPGPCPSAWSRRRPRRRTGHCRARRPRRGLTGRPCSHPWARAGRRSAASPGRVGSQGAAVWLRPPEPGCEVEASLPTLSALGGGGGAPDLVRLVDTVATQCHRVRLRRACAQPSALRAQGR